MSSPSLFTLCKGSLPEHKNALSDDEFILLNRRDFHISQISPVHPTLTVFGVKVGYPFRVLLSMLDNFAAGLQGADFNIVLTDVSLGLAAYQVWLRAGGCSDRGLMVAPKGMARFPQTNGIADEIVRDMIRAADTSPSAKVPEERAELFTFVLGNTKSSTQTLFAVDRFLPVRRGLLLLKDFGRVGAADEREYLESKGILPSVTFEGHGFVVRL
jgi:hypothetical protein